MEVGSAEDAKDLPQNLKELRSKCKNTLEVVAFIAANLKRYYESHQLQIVIEPWHHHFQWHDLAFRAGPFDTALVYQELAQGLLGLQSEAVHSSQHPQPQGIYALQLCFQLPRCQR